MGTKKTVKKAVVKKKVVKKTGVKKARKSTVKEVAQFEQSLAIAREIALEGAKGAVFIVKLVDLPNGDAKVSGCAISHNMPSQALLDLFARQFEVSPIQMLLAATELTNSDD